VETLILSCGAAASPAPDSRLARERGRVDAVVLQIALLADVAEAGRRWRAARAVGDENRRLVFAVDDDGADPVVVDLAWRVGAHLERGAGGSPAERLRAVVDAEFARGARAVAVVGSRAPTLPPHLVEHAFRALAWERCVLGPTFDGGLWLLGVQRAAPVALPGGDWSCPQTLGLLAARLPEPPHLLPFWYDVADADAVERLVWHLRALRALDRATAPASWRALERLGLIHAAGDAVGVGDR